MICRREFGNVVMRMGDGCVVWLRKSWMGAGWDGLAY